MPDSLIQDVLWHSVCQTVGKGSSVRMVRRGFRGALGVGLGVSTAVVGSWLRRSVGKGEQ